MHTTAAIMWPQSLGGSQGSVCLQKCVPQFLQTLNKWYKQTKKHNLSLLRFSSKAHSKQETQVYTTGELVTDESIALNTNSKFIELKSCWRSCGAAGSGIIHCNTFAHTCCTHTDNPWPLSVNTEFLYFMYILETLL